MRIRANASRYSKETGKLWDANLLFNLQQAAKIELAPGLPKYYFHMHEIPKVGFNLHPSYGNTPFGIYAYPLNGEYLQKLLDTTLPYRSDSPLVTILELVDPNTVLLAGAIGDYRKRLLPVYTTERDRVKHLRQLIASDGYTSVFDEGKGHIHKSEPAQIAFLTSSAFNVVETFETRALRKKTEWRININDLAYGKPQFGIPVAIWNKELRLWATDCVEHVLHLWENWAVINLPEYLDAPRNAVNASRGYANYELSDRELKRYRDRVEKASDAATYAYGIAKAAYWASTTNLVAAANFASDSEVEMAWQKEALIQRLSQAAPSKANLIRRALT